VLEVINAQRTRLSMRELLTAAYAQEPNEKAALFRIIGEVADEGSLSELIAACRARIHRAAAHHRRILGASTSPKCSARCRPRSPTATS
jgi:hypothetical protein